MIELLGTVVDISDEQNKKGYIFREFVLETGSVSSPNPIPIRCVKGSTKLLDFISMGDIVTCKCVLKGKKWEDRIFLNVECFSISVEQKYSDIQKDGITTNITGNDESSIMFTDDDLPF